MVERMGRCEMKIIPDDATDCEHDYEEGVCLLCGLEREGPEEDADYIYECERESRGPKPKDSNLT